MDNIHRPEDFEFISDVIGVREFYEKASKALTVDDRQIAKFTSHEESQDLANQLGCPSGVVEELGCVCDVENLRCEGEDEMDPLKAEVDCRSSLMTTEIQKRELEKRLNATYKQMQSSLLKYKRFNFKLIDSFKEVVDEGESSSKFEPPDVVLTVFLTRPYNKPLEKHEVRLGRLLTMDTVFYVLGRQKLSVLRDKINCLSDWAVLEDFSQNPDKAQEILTRDVYKSAFFYINGTFYNDMRYDGCTDLSENVISWAKKRSQDIGPLTAEDMDSTTFLDLSLRLGNPYLYLHQGTCEHLVIFTDMRLMNPADSQSLSDYPMQVSYNLKKRVACCACKIYTARWIAFEHEKLPFDPGFFCDTCFRSFNYDSQGNKRYKFRAIPYYDRTVL